ncbi:unnamed protein product [Anisakis simplex]|uniref:Lactamase_B domain-containing protein n=1 Tax=Anisakis simplex TaxID=6269 RepID=A0A0M3K291_ANISI|nr:unnamed protein product [Anisakis simplex]
MFTLRKILTVITSLLIDTGCGSGDLNQFIRSSRIIGDKQKLIVINTHNHPEQTGGNWSFSTTGKFGLSHNVECLCASSADENYTKLRDTQYDWQVKVYKLTRWIANEEIILLGDSNDLKNVVKVIHSPGHTPDSIILWYQYDNRVFIGDIFYQFSDILLIYDWSNIKDYERSVRSLVNFIAQQEEGHTRTLRYSSAKSECDNRCSPTLKNFHRFLLTILAGVQSGIELRIDEYEGSRYETRDKDEQIAKRQSYAIFMHIANTKNDAAWRYNQITAGYDM